MNLLPAPTPPVLDPEDPRTRLTERVREALRALPAYFDTKTNIEGLGVTDLFSLNALLASTIEVQVVETLNRMRSVWDPGNEWPLYSFERQTQTFPDVLLRKRAQGGSAEVVLGIELKGWYLLAKEGVPSFRYTVTPGACTEWDLLAVVPWHLENVLAGAPRAGVPGVWSARHTAEYRNHWWRHERSSRSDSTIVMPTDARPHDRREHTADRPVSDAGHNFGRIARIGIMQEWIDEQRRAPIAGIPARNWVEFLRRHVDQSDPQEVFDLLAREVEAGTASAEAPAAAEAMEALRRLIRALRRNG